MANDGLNGVQKAAVLLITLGPERSADIFKHLKEDEIEELTLEIANTKSVSPEVKEMVLEEFYQVCLAQQYIAEGGIGYAKQLLDNLKTVSEDERAYIEQIIREYLVLFFLEACRLLAKDESGMKQHDRQDIISQKFFHELSRHFRKRRTVEFYGKTIGTTPKRLSHIVLENTGKSACIFPCIFELFIYAF